jgi:hypothetical protein
MAQPQPLRRAAAYVIGRQRGLANPWRLPALHSRLGGEEKWATALPAPQISGLRSVG